MKDVVVIFDPTIDVNKYGEISLPDFEYGSDGNGKQNPDNKSSKRAGAYSPFIDINGIVFSESRIKSCSIKVGSFLPEITVSLYDEDKALQSYSNLTDVTLKIFIRSKNKDFKPVRQNYKITNCNSYNSEEKGSVISMSGVLMIPELFSDTIKCYPKMTSFDTLQKIAKELQLGFSCNEFSTVDEMTRICPNISLLEFVNNDISLSMYKDDESFFKIFIDQYYYLNVVEVNQLISLEEEYQKINSIISSVSEDLNGDTDSSELLDDFFLTNINDYNQTDKFIGSHSFSNEIGSSINNFGDKLYMQYYDSLSNEYKEFFATPLITSGTSEEDKTTETIDKITKSVHIGSQQNDNVHKNYYFAKTNNTLNNVNLTKFNLKIDLNEINNAIRCYMLIPVVIEEKDSNKHVNKDSEYEKDDKKSKKMIVDKFMSGFYVSTAVEYNYSENETMVCRVVCSKREFKAVKIDE